MPIHTQKLPTFALYAAYADEFGVPVFGSTRDEALNNLAEEIRAQVGDEGRELATKERNGPARQSTTLQAMAGGEGE